jgi:hypothetical protein
LLGDRFAVPEGVPPPIGLNLVGAFLKALPERLKPPELADRILLEAADTISSETIAKIKG